MTLSVHVLRTRSPTNLETTRVHSGPHGLGKNHDTTWVCLACVSEECLHVLHDATHTFRFVHQERP